MLSSISGSVIGVEMTYPPLAHFPKSISRQRSLQKGTFSEPASTSVRQVGQRSDRAFFRGISNLDDRKLIYDLCYQIIIVRFSDLTAVELARLELLAISEIIDEQLAVNFRSVHLRPAFPEQLCFL
jgi:hypothetical protein